MRLSSRPLDPDAPMIPTGTVCMRTHNYAVCPRRASEIARDVASDLDDYLHLLSLDGPRRGGDDSLSRPDPREGLGRISFHSHRAAPMAGDNIPMTKAGADAIKREIKRLKAVERPRIVQEIAVARDHGDLSENAEYHAAKERQSHVEGRIQMLEDRLARAEIIDVSRLSGDRVVEQARAYATAASAGPLDRLAASVRGFDAAGEEERRKAIAALVRELGALLPVPLEIAALAQGMSGAGGRLAPMSKEAAAAPKTPADPLSTPVIQLRGVGPAIAEKLEAKGLRTTGDLLLNLPRRYEDRRTPRTVAQAPVGERSVIAGKIVKAQEASGRR